MPRAFITMLGFNTAEMIAGALQNLDESTTDSEHRMMIKTLFNCGYPGTDRQQLKDLAVRHGFWFTDIPNQGGLENHNRVIHEYCHMQKGDYYVTFDPDVRMQQRGWLSAGIEILSANPDCVFVCAARPYHDEDWCARQHGRKLHKLSSGTRYASYRELIAWSTGVFKGEWLAARPRDFAASNEWYGYFEHADVALMNKHGKTWLSLVDFYDHHQGAEPKYTEWKRQSGAHETKISFEEWLKCNSSK